MSDSVFMCVMAHAIVSIVCWQMGFDAGNRANYYAHPWSRTGSVANLDTSSNCGVTGRYVYSVAGAVIISVAEGASCNWIISLFLLQSWVLIGAFTTGLKVG